MKLPAVFFTLAFVALSLNTIHAYGAETKNPHTLIVGLDGISYQTVLKMHQSGHFKKFQKPIPMVATFPSISDPNWAHILRAPVENNYTRAGFEMTKNSDGTIGKEFGTIIDHLTKPPQFEKKFDYKAEGFFEHLMTMALSETSAFLWTESLLRYLLNPKNLKNKNTTKAFIINTDIISHVGGENKVIEYLKTLDNKIEALKVNFKETHGRNLKVVLVSDHGNHFKKPTAIDYKKPLEEKGYFQRSSLKEKTDYAFVAPEIISFGAFYTLPGAEASFAKEMANVKGVHVALILNSPNTIHVFSKSGMSRINVNPTKKTIAYEVLSGDDPFNHIRYFKNKKQLTWSEYFKISFESDYPNALVRAWEGFYKNAKNPASVLVSAELGYVFTNMTLQILTAVSGVQSTHGSFHKEESFGVIMSTLPLSEEASTSFGFKDLIK